MDAHKNGDDAKSEKLLNEALAFLKLNKRKKMKNYMVTTNQKK